MLDNAQTYIGVLATFIVLCLFNEKKKKNDDDNQSNFLLSILFKVGKERLDLLENYTKELQQDINLVFENKGGITSHISELLEKAEDSDNKNKLLRILKEVRVQANLFFDEANAVITKLEEQEKLAQEREELTYIALISLMLIIFVMLVDCITILPIEFSCKFVLFTMLMGSVYSFILYKRYLQSEKKVKESFDRENRPEQFLKPSKMKMIIGLSLAFVIWNVISLFVNSKYFSFILLLCVLVFGVKYTKQKWISLCAKYSRYNRVFILKHGLYIIGYSLFCASFLEIMLSDSFIYDLGIIPNCELYMNNWVTNVSLLSDPTLIKYIVLIFFTLNGLILPFLLGYIKWTHLEKKAILRLKELQKKRKENVLESQKELRIIERQIETNG